MSLSEGSLCLNTNVANVVIVLVFFLSLITFRIVSNKYDKRTEEEKIERKKLAEEYFNKHLREMSNFFN